MADNDSACENDTNKAVTECVQTPATNTSDSNTMNNNNKCCCNPNEKRCCEINCRCALCRVYHRYTQCGRPSLNVMCCRGRWWKSPMKPKSKSVTSCCLESKGTGGTGADNCGTNRGNSIVVPCCPTNTGCCNRGGVIGVGAVGRVSGGYSGGHGGGGYSGGYSSGGTGASGCGCCQPLPCQSSCPPPPRCCAKTITTTQCGCKLPCCGPRPRPCAKSVSCCTLDKPTLCKCTYTPTFKCCPQDYPLTCCPRNNACQTTQTNLPACCNNNNDQASCCRYSSATPTFSSCLDRLTLGLGTTEARNSLV